MLKNLLLFILFCNALKVFVVPHSHNDAGWLTDVKTCYNDYCRNSLNNMMQMMKKIPSLKYCWSEIVFLKWWLDENPKRIPLLKELIQSKRFEIVGGGWVQNDDVLPDFELILRQMEAGFEYINRTLGVNEVKIGWQLDPFGHSSMIPALWEKMGFDTLVVARIDREYKVNLNRNTWNEKKTWNLYGKEKGLEVKMEFLCMF